MSWLFFKQGTGIAPPCRYNERREKQAAAQQTFVFHKPLTNEPPALAGSGARMRGGREFKM